MATYIPFNEEGFQGDGWTVHFRDWTTGGSAINITNWKIFHTAKKRLEDADNDAVIKRDSDNDPLLIVKYDNNANGFPDSFSVTYNATDTVDMTPREYFQDIQIVDGSADPRTYAYGTLTILGDVTKRVVTT